MQGYVRFSCQLLLLLCLLAVNCCAQDSGRFRYGAISWRRLGDPGSLRVAINVESAWRLSHESIVVFGTTSRMSAPGQMFKIVASEQQDPLLKFGDNDIIARFDVMSTRIEPLQDMVVGVSEFVHTYPSMGVYNVSLTFCCKVAGNQNAMRSASLITVVDLSNPNVLGSPVIQVLPEVWVDAIQSSQKSFAVPAIFQDIQKSPSRSLLWAMGTVVQYGYRSVPPSTSVVQEIDASTGMLTVNTECHNAGTCSEDLNVVVSVTDGLAMSSVDFIVRMQTSSTNAIPTLTLIAPPAPSPYNSMETTGNQIFPIVPRIEAFVGFPLVLGFRAADANALQSSYVELSTLPAGSGLSDRIGSNPSTQTLRWLPTADQTGPKYICASALDLSPLTPCTPCVVGAVACSPTCPEHARSMPLCFGIYVNVNPVPTFVEPANNVVNLYMNQELRMRVRAEVLQNWADSVTVVANNVHPAGSMIVPVAGEPNTVEFVWTPGKFFGGWSQDVCFRAFGTAGPGRTVVETVHCVKVTVVKCMWSVGAGETLDSIADIFGSNYVQLWALNVERNSPDSILLQGDLVRIGHLYQVRPQDNIRYLSVNFATTRGTLEMLNYMMIDKETKEKDPLATLAGFDMCILPHSCVESAVQ